MAAAAPALSEEEAVRLAKEWYDAKGPFVGDLVLSLPPLGVHLNYGDEEACEYSVRYRCTAAETCSLDAEALEESAREYFVRFFFEREGEGAWECWGLDEQRASEQRDSGAELNKRLWAKLVEKCARALKRAASNLPVYTSPSSIELQVSALGAEAVAKILELSRSEGELSEEDKDYVIESLTRAGRSSSLNTNNGAKAALNSVKYIAGGGNASTARASSSGAAGAKAPRRARASGDAPRRRKRPAAALGGEMRKVLRDDDTSTTKLRRQPNDDDGEDAWLENDAAVENDDVVELLEADAGGGFAKIRTEQGDEGYVRAAYLHVLQGRRRRASGAVNFNEKALSARLDSSMEEEKREAAPVYEVEAIVDKRMNDAPIGKRKKGVEYRVRWKGYAPDEDTWEPVSALGSVMGKVRRFEQQLAKAQRAGEKGKAAKRRKTGDAPAGSGSDSDDDGGQRCRYCGGLGHNRRTCPNRPRQPPGPPPERHLTSVLLRPATAEELKTLAEEERKQAHAPTAEDKAWLAGLDVGSDVDAEDTKVGEWHPARVVSVRKAGCPSPASPGANRSPKRRRSPKRSPAPAAAPAAAAAASSRSPTSNAANGGGGACSGEDELKIHFMGFHARYDVWVPRSRSCVLRRGEAAERKVADKAREAAAQKAAQRAPLAGVRWVAVPSASVRTVVMTQPVVPARSAAAAGGRAAAAPRERGAPGDRRGLGRKICPNVACGASNAVRQKFCVGCGYTFEFKTKPADAAAAAAAGGGAAPAAGTGAGRAAVRGNYPKPSGRAPVGKAWSFTKGVWVDVGTEAAQAAPPTANGSLEARAAGGEAAAAATASPARGRAVSAGEGRFPLPALPELPPLVDGIASWNEFQRMPCFKGHKNADVAVRWQQYQEDGRSGEPAAAAGGAAAASRASGGDGRLALPELPELPPLPDGIPSWNEFQRMPCFKGQLNGDVAARWQAYQAAGRKGVGEQAKAAWDARPMLGREQITPPAPAPADEEEWLTTGNRWIGVGCLRYFHHVPVVGTIVAWLPPTAEDPALWRLRHEDGDEEDLEEHEGPSNERALLRTPCG